MFKTSAIRLSLIMLIITGCTTLSEVPDKSPPNLHIASANLIKNFGAINGMVLAKYQLDSIYNGKFLKGDYVYVVIKENTIPEEGLAEQAILLLHYNSELLWYNNVIRDSYKGEKDDDIIKTYVPLQNDALKGILPDTPENQEKVKELSLKRIEGQAIEKAQKICQKNDIGGCKCKAKKYPYGWVIYCDYTSLSAPGPTIHVGDNGKIKNVFFPRL